MVASMPPGAADDFSLWLCGAAEDLGRTWALSRWWPGVAHLAGVACCCATRVDYTMIARVAATRSRSGRAPHDVRAAYRSLAWVLFRAARGLS